MCHGPSCYMRILLTFVGVTLGAIIVGVILWYRTQAFYKDVHRYFQQSKETGVNESIEVATEEAQ